MSTLMTFRVRGTTSPFSYRIYGPPVADGDNTAPITNDTLRAHTIYCTPWLTGQGGPIDAIHAYIGMNSPVAHWGVYAALNVRFAVPGGLLVSNSAALRQGAGNVSSVALVYSAVPNALHYLAFACNTTVSVRRMDIGFGPPDMVPVLGVDSRGLGPHWGIAASYNVTAGLPATFPQTGWEFLGTISSHYPLWMGVHYA